jgi:hypothetical protein
MNSTDLDKTAARRRGGRGTLYAAVFLVLLAGGVGLWTWLTLQWSYSDGTRAGILQKFSQRGWVCKTREGELAQYVVAGVSPQIWQFSVRDAAVAAQIEKVVGARVQLHYTEHPGVPSTCFADTRYFVDRVTVMDPNPSPWPAAPMPAGPGTSMPGNSAPANTTPAAPTPVSPAPGTSPQPAAPTPSPAEPPRQ